MFFMYDAKRYLPVDGAVPNWDEHKRLVEEFSLPAILGTEDGFFAGKVRSKPEDRVVIVTHGAPGSGKTFYLESLGLHQMEHLVYVPYDETVQVEGATPQLSQYVLSRVLERAVREGHSLVLDTHGAGPNMPALLDNLKDHGYRIDVRSLFAPCYVARERACLLNEADFLELRKSAGQVFPRLCARADYFEALYNPQDGEAPRLYLRRDRGWFDLKNSAILDEVLADVMTEQRDSSPTRDFLAYVQQRQEIPSVPNNDHCTKPRVAHLVQRCG
jgi:hypothetical protein